MCYRCTTSADPAPASRRVNSEGLPVCSRLPRKHRAVSPIHASCGVFGNVGCRDVSQRVTKEFRKEGFTYRPLSCFPCIHNTTDPISKTIKGFLRLARVLSDAGTAQRFDRSIPSQPQFAPKSIPRHNTPAAAPGNGRLARGQSCK